MASYQDRVKAVKENDHLDMRYISREVDRLLRKHLTNLKEQPGDITTLVGVRQGTDEFKHILLEERDVGGHYEYCWRYRIAALPALEEGRVEMHEANAHLMAPAEDLEHLYAKARKADWDGPGPKL